MTAWSPRPASCRAYRRKGNRSMCIYCRAGKARDEWAQEAKTKEVVTLRDETGDSWDPGHPTTSLLHLMRDRVDPPVYILVAQTFNDVEEDRFNAVLLDKNHAIKLVESLSRMLTDDPQSLGLSSTNLITYESLKDWGRRVVDAWYQTADMDMSPVIDEFEDAFPDYVPDESLTKPSFQFDFAGGIRNDFPVKDILDGLIGPNAQPRLRYTDFLEFGGKPENDQDDEEEKSDGNQDEKSRESKINPIGWEIKITPIRGE
jgi:hypothetical protein